MIQKTDGEFGKLHTLLENQYRKLHQEGVGAQKAQARIIKPDEEQMLWASNTFNTYSPEGILNAIFYYNGINFILRGGSEHRNLSTAQFCFGSSGEALEYVSTQNMDRRTGQVGRNN